MNTTEVRFKSAESSVLENTVGVAEEEFAQSNMEKEKKKEKNKKKNLSSKVQAAQREVQMRSWDRDDITKFRTHLLFFLAGRKQMFT